MVKTAFLFSPPYSVPAINTNLASRLIAITVSLLHPCFSGFALKLGILIIVKSLEKEIPGSIGRYDETFNPDCFGDSFTQLGTPTILFEAGHVPNDYQREKTRLYIFEALKALFISILQPNQDFKPKSRFGSVLKTKTQRWGHFWSHFQNPENVLFAPGTPPHNSKYYTEILTKM